MSGLNPLTALCSASRLRMSANVDSIRSPTDASSNKLSSGAGGSAYPATIAPDLCSQSDSHDPLKPVCPVKNTRLPCQNWGSTTTPSMAHSSRPKFPRDGSCPSKYPSPPKSHCDGMRATALLPQG